MFHLILDVGKQDCLYPAYVFMSKVSRRCLERPQMAFSEKLADTLMLWMKISHSIVYGRDC